MMIDLRNVQSEEVLLEDINTRVSLLLKAVRKYVAYKMFSADGAISVKDLREETNDIHELLKALTIYEESRHD